ncbi:hypothetical protein BGW80DRAFT_1247046 [Lactifluus volemus]|nr:hypothetical protein BGW80DRAFT_1247046 [Lactifluus volemus]
MSSISLLHLSILWSLLLLYFPYLSMHACCVEIVGKFIAIVAAISESIYFRECLFLRVSIAKTIARFVSHMSEPVLAVINFVVAVAGLFPHTKKHAGAGKLVHHCWLDRIIIQGEIDIIWRTEEEKARHRLPSSTVLSLANVDVLKPVDNNLPGTNDK